MHIGQLAECMERDIPFTAVVVAGAVIVAGVVGALVTVGMGDEASVPSPTPEHSVSYDAGQERLTIRVSGGGYAMSGQQRKGPHDKRPGGEVRTVRVFITGPDAEKGYGGPVSIKNGTQRSQNGTWYSENGSGVSAWLPTAGGSVVLYEDGTDRDGDGLAGAENGDVYRIRSEQTIGGATTHLKIAIVNGSACTGAMDTCDPHP